MPTTRARYAAIHHLLSVEDLAVLQNLFDATPISLLGTVGNIGVLFDIIEPWDGVEAGSGLAGEPARDIERPIDCRQIIVS